MAETAEIAKMANKVSKDIFNIFGWQRRPHTDLNFPCGVEEHKRKTHPADVVFSYNSPTEQNKIFLNVDLKSYASNSITSGQVSTAINNLITTVDCANASSVWRERYGGDDQNYDVHALLFVYNHDGKFDKGWANLITDARVFLSKIKKNHRIYVLGPPDIEYLVNVADDIVRQRGGQDKDLPDAEFCNFFYPDMVIQRVGRCHNEAATLEVLTSPWQILCYSKAGKNKNQSGAYCYYRGSGETVDEFKFLIDYLFRFQLVADDYIISIRMPFAARDASARFETAKEQYCKDHHNLSEFKQRLDRIGFYHVARVRDHFDETQLGMD